MLTLSNYGKFRLSFKIFAYLLKYRNGDNKASIADSQLP